MSHDTVLRTIGAGGTRATVDRIMDTWAKRTASDLESGATWYPSHDAILESMVAMGAPSKEHAAVAFAHLSTRTLYAKNLAGALALVSGGREEARRHVFLTRNLDAAERALAAEDPWTTYGPKSPKTRAFALNLLGDEDAVTVDTWAARIALPEHIDGGKVLSRAGVYDAIAHCYRLAAKRAGVSAPTMQATTWITARGGRAF